MLPFSIMELQFIVQIFTVKHFIEQSLAGENHKLFEFIIIMISLCLHLLLKYLKFVWNSSASPLKLTSFKMAAMANSAQAGVTRQDNCPELWPFRKS